MMIWLSVLLAVFALYAVGIVVGLRARRVDIWWRDYFRGVLERVNLPAGTCVDVMFCFVDHFEPRWNAASPDVERQRVKRWMDDYPRTCDQVLDSDGVCPQHTFFYPSEEYHPDHIGALVGLCARGYGEIEIHLHHDNDTEAGLRSNLEEFLGKLSSRHNALPCDPVTGAPRWSFVHGNWALDNSRDDGRWCGVNNELEVLASLGCYADFTLPSAPSDTQTQTVNRLYYATDDPDKPKSHDTGTQVRVGGAPTGHMMIVQGPLGMRWKLKGLIPVPAIENSDIRAGNLPTPARVDQWVRTAIGVAGRPNWVFVKVHTHGTQDRDIDALLGKPTREMYEYLASKYNDGKRYRLHFVTAREMYNIARAAEAGVTGNPGGYRDYVIPRPPYRAQS